MGFIIRLNEQKDKLKEEDITEALLKGIFRIELIFVSVMLI